MWHRALPRASGVCRIVVGRAEEGSQIVEVFQRSPLRMIFSQIAGARVKQAVLLILRGPIAGGDRVECSVTAVANALIAVTSQTAERVYGALLKPVRVMTKLKVSDGSRLAWFPQETMIFNWARLHRETEVDISCEVESLHSSGLCSVVGDHGEQTVRAES